MDHYRIIAETFQDTIESISLSVDTLAEGIERGSKLMVEALLADRKVVSCGNGADAALAQLFTCNLLDRFADDRPALPALTLGTDPSSITAIARSGGWDDVYSRQLHALGQGGDVLLCLNTRGRAENLSRVVRTARERNIGIIVLSHDGDAGFDTMTGNMEVFIRIKAANHARLVELYTIVIHCFCGLIDLNLFGTYNRE